MKNLRSYLFGTFMMLIFSMTFFTSCGEDGDPEETPIIPSAGFTAAIDGLEVTFTNSSTAAVTYSWNFGDNSDPSTDENPVYTYAAAGTYTVVLTVTSSTGDTDTESKEVTVAEVVVPIIPVAAFSTEVDALNVTFTNSSTDAIAYSWNFGDNTDASTDENPIHTYANAGTYTVVLTATSSTGDTDTESQEVTVALGGIDPSLLVAGGNNFFDLYSGVEGSQNVGDWVQDTFTGIKPLFTRGVANPDASDTAHPLVGKYERTGTSTGGDGKYVRIYVKPSAIPLTWGERTKFSIRVYMPAANDPDNTLLERKIALKLRTTAGASSEISVGVVLDASADDTWTTVELDLANATGGTDRVFNPAENYDRLLIQLGGELETEGRGYWYLSDFVRL